MWLKYKHCHVASFFFSLFFVFFYILAHLHHIIEQRRLHVDSMNVILLVSGKEWGVSSAKTQPSHQVLDWILSCECVQLALFSCISLLMQLEEQLFASWQLGYAGREDGFCFSFGTSRPLEPHSFRKEKSFISLLLGMQFLYTTVFGIFTAFVFLRTGETWSYHTMTPPTVPVLLSPCLPSAVQVMLWVQCCATPSATVGACRTSALSRNTLIDRLWSSSTWWGCCCFCCSFSRWRNLFSSVPFPSAAWLPLRSLCVIIFN